MEVTDHESAWHAHERLGQLNGWLYAGPGNTVMKLCNILSEMNILKLFSTTVTYNRVFLTFTLWVILILGVSGHRKVKQSIVRIRDPKRNFAFAFSIPRHHD